jgi:hypothetical protein
MRKWLLVASAIVISVVVLLLIVGLRIRSGARERLEKALEERFDSEVDLGSLKVDLFPSFSAVGEGLVLRRKGQLHLPPLIEIRKFSAETGWMNLLRHPLHVGKVRLEGLQLHVPAHKSESENPNTGKQGKQKTLAFVIDEIDADGTTLETLPKEAGKQPLHFDLYRLKLLSAGADRAMSFRATLKNPKPPGMIETKGDFGPWQTHEPGETPVSGSYTFENANLAVFRGIAGILSSQGKYKGELDRIEVDGATETPDFKLTTGGHQVHLKTQFHAIVDGTNGDTLLQPVKAQFLNTSVETSGGVAGKPGVKGKTVSLNGTVSNGRVEDILRLAVKSDKPLMTGAISFQSKIVIPPGDREVIDKLFLDGTFAINAAKFTSLDLQRKVRTLSQRSRGDTDGDSAERVVSNMKGRFTLKDGVARFANLTFDVPGASIQLAGSYGLQSEALDFRGTARLQAKLSEMTTGFKSILLKALDPLFKKKGSGAVIPIKIGGTRQDPSFGLDIGGH